MDDSLLLLLPLLQENLPREGGVAGKPSCLLVADENLIDIPFANLSSSVQVLSNRFDIAKLAQLAGRNSIFNDFDFSVFTSASFKRVVYRVSKEKPVAHHIINHSLRLLDDDGVLILVGAKSEGIKTYASKAASYFNTRATVKKQGKHYLATIHKNSASLDQAETRLLALKTPYEELAPIIHGGGVNFYTKSGLFGWNKIDRGSALLVEHVSEFFKDFTSPPTTLLDLGCGYGYLSVMAALISQQQIKPLRIVASDNCAAAIIACRKNFSVFNIDAEVVADDCASGITGTFDALLCNPPFHQGFTTDSRLTEKFLAAAARHLSSSGRALFVVNQFVPLEKLAQSVFSHTEKLAEADGFRLVILRKM